MLSSSTRSAPASTASPTSSTESPSTSTGTSGNAARTARNASATPPAATTWLSLTIAASDSDMRWLTPPPQRTAYFSSARRPGVVLRVSRTAAPVPSTASAQRRVSVAMPDSRHSRFSAVRSPVSSPRVAAVSDSSTSPRPTRVAVLDAPAPPRPRRRSRPRTPRPRRPARRPRRRPARDEVGGRLLVERHGRRRWSRRAPPARSSSSARRTTSRTYAGSSPAATRRRVVCSVRSVTGAPPRRS